MTIPRRSRAAIVTGLIGGLLVLAPGSGAAQEPDEPLALHDYHLGTSLAEFRQLPYADAIELDARLVCSGDPFARQNNLEELLSGNLTQEEARIDVKLCKYFYHERNNASSVTSWREAGIPIGDLGRRPASFYFMPKMNDPRFSERLFRIIVTFNYTQAVPLMSVYMLEYGPPLQIDVETQKSENDAIYDSTISTWREGRNELKISNRFGQDAGSVTYVELYLLQQLDVLELVEQIGKTDSEP